MSKVLTRNGNSNALNRTNVECSVVFLSKMLGACHCEVIMPLINIETRYNSKSCYQCVEIILSYMNDQLRKDDFCCRINNLL